LLHPQHAARADAPLDLDRQSLARPFVRHGQALQLLAVGAAVEHEVVRPDLVRSCGRLRLGPAARDPPARPLARNLQARCAPEPVRPPRAHGVAVAPEKDLDAVMKEIAAKNW
jgi:hypothetical protein